MTKLAPNVAIDTPAGSLWMPDWLDVWYAPTAAEKRSLFDHMTAIELPPSAWNEWRADVRCERVSDIRSYYGLFTIWLRVALWQKACRVTLRPTCEWGISIFQQATIGPKKSIEIPLTPAPVSLFS